jgi:hypothetical protein
VRQYTHDEHDADAAAMTIRCASRSAASDLQFPENRNAFRRIAELSAQVDALYSATMGKWIEATSTPLSAQLLEWLHPMRVSR